MSLLLSFIFSAIKADLSFLHESWMGLFFPHQHGGGHPVLGRYRPQTRPKLFAYYAWAILGIPAVILLYPFVLVGFAIRLTTIRLSRTAARLGIIGVVIFVGVVWGLLAVLAFLQLTTTEFVAIATAAIVATISAGIAVLGHDVGGRGLTVAIAYPASVTAIFLPPVVAALIWESLGNIILPGSEALAIWILDEILFVYGLNDLIRSNFNLEGAGFLGMWLGISLFVGWLLGILVTLADAVRPREPDTADQYAR